LAFLLGLNPTLVCNNLQIGQMVCVALNPASIVTTTPSSIGGLTCSSYYTVKSGDTCYYIAGQYGITLDTFLAINNNQLVCSNLQIGQNICVPGTRSCTRYYVVQSGNTCYSISLSSGLTLDAFLAKNIGINCGNLQIGQAVCLA
jgi:LysM repeat protein